MKPVPKILTACVILFLLSITLSPASSQSWRPTAATVESNTPPSGLTLPAWNEANLSEINTAPLGTSPVENNQGDGTPTHAKPDGIPYSDNQKASLYMLDENIARVQIDVNGDNDLDNLWFRFVDTNEDNVFDCLQISAYENMEFDQGTPDDNIVDTDEDENISIFGSWVDNIRIGPSYRYSIYALVDGENSVAIKSYTWWTGVLSVDVNDDGAVDTVNFCLSDSDSDGRFDTLDISNNLIYGEDITGGNENRITATSDVRIGVTKTLTFGSSNDFEVMGPVSSPADQTPDFNVKSTSWYTGTILVEMDDDNQLDNLYVCLSDKDSDGVFDIYELSAFNDNFGQGTAAQLTDNLIAENLAENNDERLTAYTDNLHLEPGRIRYEVAAPVANPHAQSVDFQLRAKSWYTSTITLHGGNTFNFVIWDPDSDGVFENLVLDDDRNGSYADDPQFDNYPTSPLPLPRNTGYAYEIVEFSHMPAYGDSDLVLRPLDADPPVFSDPSPASGTTVTSRRPPITVKLVDQATENITFGIDEGSIVMQVQQTIVLHSFSNGTVSYVPPTDFPDGEINVSVTARDLAHNSASFDWSFTVEGLPPEPFPLEKILIIFLFVVFMVAFVGIFFILVTQTVGKPPKKEEVEFE